MKEPWIVTMKDKQRVTVMAADQWEAFDVLRDKSFHDLGIMTVAFPARADGSVDETYAARTTALLVRWGLPYEAAYLTSSLVQQGFIPIENARELPEWDEAVWLELSNE
jgi:DNA mismatch repair protein MutH